MSDCWEAVRASFGEESREGLDELDRCLLALEAEPDRREPIDGAFRAVHSLKGTASTLGFPACAELAHSLESLLIRVRDGERKPEPELIDLALRCSDVLRQLLEDRELLEGTRRHPSSASLIEELARHASPGPADSVPGQATVESEPVSYLVVFRPAAGFFAVGADPALVLQELAGLGALEVRVELDRLPALRALDPELCHLGWTCRLTTSAGEQAVREVFAFYEDLAEVSVAVLGLELDPVILEDFRREALEHVEAIGVLLLELERPGQHAEARARLLRCLHSLKGASGILCSAASLPPPADHPAAWIRAGAHQAESALERGQLDAEALFAFNDAVRLAVSRLPEPTPPRAARAASPLETVPTLRVEQARLDHLLRVVGEVMVTQSALQSMASSGQIAARPEHAARFKEVLTTLRRSGRELHERVMALRMLPLRTVFQRFPRLVRDLGRSLGKDIRLVLEGEAIELDRSVLEKIGDPLMHLVRNAADHGLEGEAERLAAGKPAHGTICLSAEHQATTVVIQVRDDGRGLDRARLRARAVEAGWVAEDEVLSEGETARLVFRAGLSTASQVTDVSGRGVGMDVVQNNVRELQGTIDIESEPGRGCTFSIRLPASLVVTRGIVVGCAGEQLILPMETARELLTVRRRDQVEIQGERFLSLRGELVPLVSLAEELGLPSGLAPELQAVAVIDAAGQRLAVAVDSFETELEVLVKPLEGPLGSLPMYAGASIAGDGRVLLVIDPGGLRAAA